MKIKTLFLYSNGIGKKNRYIDSFKTLVGLNYVSKKIPDRLNKYRIFRSLLGNRYGTLSYIQDWQDAFLNNPDLEVISFNINNFFEYNIAKKNISQYDLIIISHSAAGDNMDLLLDSANLYLKRTGKLVLYIGNEYDLMPEKFDFIKKAGVDFICSQLPYHTAKWLYNDLGKAKVIEQPHALNPKVYTYNPENTKRNINVGFRGDLYPIWIGDTDRNDFLKYANETFSTAYHLKIDCVFNKRLERKEWSKFLRDCDAIIGGESGSLYLDKRGEILTQTKNYLNNHPEADLDELKREVLQKNELEYISGRAISSRHFEPIGTKTCQILLEGEYNGILKANEHYIAIKKDFSNIDEAIERFKDENYRINMVEQTFDYVIQEHTYDKRVQKLLKEIN